MIYKCKICGGDLEVAGDGGVFECQSCGTMQTIPKLDDDERRNLYDRANHFRRNNDYDRAMVIYEKILESDSADPEAYWSILLCKYGVEYVEDPRTHQHIITCNRTQRKSILSDEDYKAAMEYSSGRAREIYEEEARAIDAIQKNALAISANEEPFDVFICYKETDMGGKRTKDSVRAQEIYQALTKEGYKVFFSKITLQGKLGVEYEPYIFAALNSAKIMIVVGTSKENFESTWVRNEWVRYLSLLTEDNSKALIPAYLDMDPYDLPDAFSHLQALNMENLGFIQDLMLGIDKITGKAEERVAAVPPSVGNVPAGNDEALLKRAYIFLEDSDFNSASQYFERVLDNNPENPNAYIGKLMVELQLQREDQLDTSSRPLSDFANYQRGVRFADGSYKAQLEGYNQTIVERIEENRKDEIYQRAYAKMDADKKGTLLEAALEFNSISGYKNADSNAEACRAKAKFVVEEGARKAEEARRKAAVEAEEKRLKAEREAENRRKKRRRGVLIVVVVGVIVFVAIFSFLKISEAKDYDQALQLYENQRYIEAYEQFKALGDYKDSSEKALELISASMSTTLRGGDSFFFGEFEAQPIAWTVLHIEGDNALILAKDCIAKKSYNEENIDITWENCSLRQWLNGEFMDTFSEEQKLKIQSSTIKNDNNEEYGTDGGNDTEDKVFLLSIDEAEVYLKNDAVRVWWWLRSPGNISNFAAFVDHDGYVIENGYFVNYGGGVRPALYLNLKS